jgi:hypothetical protein
MPHWFAQILPAARIGAAHLFSFARRPFNASLSPVAVLGLMSRPLNPGWRQQDHPSDEEISPWERHSVAELFVPGLRQLTREETLVPALWTEKKPVRPVTARTILLAALSRFIQDPRSLVQEGNARLPCKHALRCRALVQRSASSLAEVPFLTPDGEFRAIHLKIAANLRQDSAVRLTPSAAESETPGNSRSFVQSDIGELATLP